MSDKVIRPSRWEELQKENIELEKQVEHYPVQVMALEAEIEILKAAQVKRLFEESGL